MKFIIEIGCTNDAFSDEKGEFDQLNADREIAPILEQIAKDLDAGLLKASGFPANGKHYRDSNGNTVALAQYRPLDKD